MAGIFNAGIFNNDIFNTGDTVQIIGGGVPYDPPARTKRQISEARKSFGLDDAYEKERAAALIAKVAASQIARKEADAQKQFEELERELKIEAIEWQAQYLDALTFERDRLQREAKAKAVYESDLAIITALIQQAVEMDKNQITEAVVESSVGLQSAVEQIKALMGILAEAVSKIEAEAVKEASYPEMDAFMEEAQAIIKRLAEGVNSGR